MDEQIEGFIHDLDMYSAEHARIVEEVRDIYSTIQPDIGEKFIYGGIGFFIDGRHVGGVYGNKKHVSIVFSRGNELSDPNGLLEGNGKYRRHLKAVVHNDVAAKAVRFFVAQVVALEGGNPPPHDDDNAD